MKSEAMDANGSRLEQEVLALVRERRKAHRRNKAAASLERPVVSEDDELDDSCASWEVGHIRGAHYDYKLGQSVCLGCGFGVTFVLNEMRGRPKYCGNCGMQIARYVGA